MAIKNSWASGEVLTAADLTDTMKGVYLNAQTGTSYTFGTADGFVTLSNASGGTATIPANATAAFNTGAVIGVMNAGTAGSFTIGTAAGVTLNAVSGTTVLAPLEKAELVKLGTNTWQLAKTSPTKVLQVVSATYSTETTVTSTSFTDSGLTASITPSSSSSKVLVLIAQSASSYSASNDRVLAAHQVLRGSTAIFTSTVYTHGVLVDTATNGLVESDYVYSVSYLDSPATTSTTAYKTQQRIYSGSATAVITQPSSATSSIILMEVAA